MSGYFFSLVLFISSTRFLIFSHVATNLLQHRGLRPLPFCAQLPNAPLKAQPDKVAVTLIIKIHKQKPNDTGKVYLQKLTGDDGGAPAANSL
jgi:hypothetical protein